MAYTKQSTEEKREKARERPIVGQYSDLAAVVRSLMGWEAESARPFLTAREASYKTGVSYSTIAAMTRGERPAADTIKRFAEGFGVDPLPLLQSAEYLENSSSLDLPDIPHDWLEKNASNLMRRGYEEKVQRVWRFWAKNEFDLLTDNEPPANLEIFLDDSFLNADPEWNSIRQGIFGVFALAIEYMDLRSKGLPDGWITSQTIEASRISINAKNFLRVIRIAIFEWSFRHYGGEQAGNIDAYWLTRYISGQIPMNPSTELELLTLQNLFWKKPPNLAMILL